MNETPQNIKPLPPGFASLADARSALKLIIPPLTDENRNSFLAKLSESPYPKQVAFRLLATLVTDEAGSIGKILSLLQTELTGVLAGVPGKSPEELPGCSTDAVVLWVRNQFPSRITHEEATKYIETEQHLWTLFQILRWSSDTAKFMAALTCYTEELESLIMSESGGKKRRLAKKAGNFASVVKTLIKRVPSRPKTMESFLENLRLCRAFAGASADLQEQLEASRTHGEFLKAQLEAERVNLAAEKSAHTLTADQLKTTNEELVAARAEAQSLRDSLKIQAGAHEGEKVAAAAEVLASMRGKFIPDLENIRLYADRSEPNTPAIIRKAQELTQFLTDFKK